MPHYPAESPPAVATEVATELKGPPRASSRILGAVAPSLRLGTLPGERRVSASRAIGTPLTTKPYQPLLKIKARARFPRLRVSTCGVTRLEAC